MMTLSGISKLAFDEIELEKWRYRRIQANRARATKGHVTAKWAAYGYTFSEDGLDYVIEEQEAHWVRLIFEWYIGGQSLRWIAKSLTLAGVPTHLNGKRGWRLETVRKILTHEVYKGTFIANRYDITKVWQDGKQKNVKQHKPESEWIYVAVPAIVSEQQWDVAQERLALGKQHSLRNARKHEWLLSGILRCVCGRMYTCKLHHARRKLASGKIASYKYGFYRCSDQSRLSPPIGCNRGLIAKHRLDELVLQALEMMVINVDLWKETLDDNSDEIERFRQHEKVYQTQLEEVEQQLAELLQLALEQRTPHMRQLFLEKQGELEKRHTDYKQQLKIVRERLELAEQKSNQRNVIEDLLANLRKLGGLCTLPFDMQRRLVLQLVDEIIFDSKEQWFEIRGVFNDKFFYDDDDQLMTSSARRA